MIWSYNKEYNYKYPCLCLTLPHSEVRIYPGQDLNNNETAKKTYHEYSNLTTIQKTLKPQRKILLSQNIDFTTNKPTIKQR